MAQDQTEPSGPDLAQGIAFSELAAVGKQVGHVGDEEVLLVCRGTRCSPWAPIAPITTGRSSTAWWSVIPCAARGTMPASTCAPATPYGPRP